MTTPARLIAGQGTREAPMPREDLPFGTDALVAQKEQQAESILISEVQLLLAEKRTSLAAMRTGITVFVLPLSVLSLLVATSSYYHFEKVLAFLIPLLALCAGLIALGVYLVHRAVLKIRHHDRLIAELKKQNSRVAHLVD